ncbi:uncharacterized protein LOC111343565 [Stylophora pistillata]|uniref:uncharacterized protein LOC111343565 n=1 Tax=Stylophora pistillata TaxID=50429 RepID=UPI000C04D27F|nr:uncharacterized protein LOC111343565 [Stylophora pistillata]
MGSIREQLLRTVRSVLTGLFNDHAQQLNDEALQTLFTEAENIVNSHPLTVDNLSDPEAPEPIRPNHLLTLKTKDFRIVYTPWQSNIADPLSCLLKQDKVQSHPHGAGEYIQFAAISATPQALTTREIEEASEADEELKVMREAIKTCRFEKYKEYAPAAGEPCVIGQLVLRGTRIVLPNKFRSQAISLAYKAHLGIISTKQNLRSKGWWPHMDKAAEKFCKSCHGCQQVCCPDPPQPLRSTTPLERPWQDLVIDLLGPLPSGHSILVLVDYYSRYYEYTIMTSTVTEKVIDNLEEMFSRHGLPLTIKSNNGPQFCSEEFREYCKQNGIVHIKTTPKWPQANGVVETMHPDEEDSHCPS